jgi:hypothetical protein
MIAPRLGGLATVLVPVVLSLWNGWAGIARLAASSNGAWSSSRRYHSTPQTMSIGSSGAMSAAILISAIARSSSPRRVARRLSPIRALYLLRISAGQIKSAGPLPLVGAATAGQNVR